MLGSSLQLRTSEEQCKTNSITPASATNPAYQLTMLLSNENRSIDIIIGDGNCFLEQFLKSCLERRDTMNVSMPFLWNMSRLTVNTSNNTCHMDLVPSWNTATTWSVCYSSGNSCTIYIFANSCLHLQ